MANHEDEKVSTYDSFGELYKDLERAGYDITAILGVNSPYTRLEARGEISGLDSKLSITFAPTQDSGRWRVKSANRNSEDIDVFRGRAVGEMQTT
jgi:hypothetical protein